MSFGSVTGMLTGGLIDPTTPNYLGAAKSAEAQRQAQIKRGQQAIDAVYGGGSFPTYVTAGGQYDPTKSYYQYDKKTGDYGLYKLPKKFAKHLKGLNGDDPGKAVGDVAGEINKVTSIISGAPWFGALGGLFGGNDGPPPPGHLLNKGKLFSAMQSPQFKGFGTDFFDKAQMDYIRYATPQLAQQYKQTKDNVLFGLSNKGLLGGSANKKAMFDLDLETGRQRQNIADTAFSTAQGLKKNIEQSRQQAIDQLYQTGDPSQAAQQAISSASQFTVPQTYAPILNAFSRIADQYASKSLYNNYVPPSFFSPYGNQSGSSSALGPVTY